MRKIIWMGSSLRDLRALPEDVKSEIGFALYHIQAGKNHASIKVLKGFGGASVQEIRINDRGGTYRAVYTIRYRELLYVLHVFQKESSQGAKTPKEDMNLIAERLARAAADFKQRSKADEKSTE